MRLDNSMATLFRKSPLDYQERYVHKITRIWDKPDVSPLDFGTRCHQLMEEHYNDLRGTPIPPYPESPNAALELEAQALYALYLNQYPVEPFTVLDVERTFEVPLVTEAEGDSGHVLIGKMDVVIEEATVPGKISIVDHKFEKRSSHRQSALAWALRSQASVYMWAATRVYNKPVDKLVLNLCKRQSDKGQVPPEFPPRQTIQRTPEQMEVAIRDLMYTANEIERCMREFGTEQPWPSYTENCVGYGDYMCEYYPLHIYGHTPETLKMYQPTVPYLDL